MKSTLVFVVTLLLAGCASLSGPELVPGKSTAAEAQARFGEPAQRLTLANGDSVLYFSTLPYGQAMYVVTVGSDGVMKSIEQRMKQATFAKIVPNSWTKKEVSELLGPPGMQGRFDRQQRDWWGYHYAGFGPRVVWLQFSDDGVLREMVDLTEKRRRVGIRED